MALLAGIKRKQKIGIDPNNTNWVNDSSTFGQSLMKKMGWKEGKGLGANEDGRTVPVKASLKIDNKGLGCTAKDADAWIAHGEEFDQILASLNQSSTITTSETNASPNTSSDQKENKKAEGQRRFYGRFSRGGVKTLRTTEDLDCILGRRKSAPSKVGDEQKGEREENDDAITDKDESLEVDKSHGFVTKTSSSSVQDYFAQKMKNRNIPSLLAVTKTDNVKEDTESDGQTDKTLKDSYTTGNCSVQEYFAKKMKARNERLLSSTSPNCASCEDGQETMCEKENFVNGEENNTDCEDHSQGTKGKKSKKKSEEAISAHSADQETELSRVDAKRDRKKRKQPEEGNDVELIETKKVKVDVQDLSDKTAERDLEEGVIKSEGSESCDNTGVSKGKKKKSKKGKTAVLDEEDVALENGSIKAKKKKRKNENEECSENIIDKSVVPGDGKTKRKNEVDESSEEMDCTNISDVTAEQEKQNVKMKKKKKKTVADDNDAVGKVGEDDECVNCEKPSSPMEINDCDKPEEFESSRKTKNGKKKERYKMKQVIVKKLEELKDLNESKWIERLRSIEDQACKELVGRDILSEIRVKLLDKAVLEKKESESSENISDKKKIVKFEKKIKKLKQAVFKGTNDTLLELQTSERSMIKKVKRKAKKNISVINEMSNKNKNEGNVELDWHSQITTVENEKKRIIAEIKKTKESITQYLEKNVDELANKIEVLEKSVAVKMEQESSNEKQCSLYPGASVTAGYTYGR